MNTLTNYHFEKTFKLNGAARSNISKVADRPAIRGNYNKGTQADPASLRPATKLNQLLSPEILKSMNLGSIPDLRWLCLDLYHTFFKYPAPHNALQFIPALQQLVSIPQEEIVRFLKNPETRQVLIQNDLLKVVLIHWVPGQISSIHGHPKGGCVFKVLKGSLEEKRYSTDDSQQLMAECNYHAGSMAYIDDSMSFHSVGNPYDSPAVSLHVYTPGTKV